MLLKCHGSPSGNAVTSARRGFFFLVRDQCVLSRVSCSGVRGDGVLGGAGGLLPIWRPEELLAAMSRDGNSSSKHALVDGIEIPAVVFKCVGTMHQSKATVC